MPILNKLSGAFPTALIYITVGALIDVWTLVLLVFNTPETKEGYLWLVGFLLTGLTLLTIGLLLGQIGRGARVAELPPSEVTAASVQAEQTTAAHPPAVVSAQPQAVLGTQPQAAVAAQPTLHGQATVLTTE